jgi:O-succinylbenzoic acid--CoA ligase
MDILNVKALLESRGNEIILNLRWPSSDYKNLLELAHISQEELRLRSHVWIATSGSTSESISTTKLVALSKQALVQSATAVNLHLKVTGQDVWTQVLPHFHVGGLGVEVRAFLSGSRVIPALNGGKWDVHHFFKILNEFGCTLSALVPTQVYDLLSAGYSAPPRLRAIIVGGGALDKHLYQKARQRGWPLLPSYGMTETASQIATASLDSLAHEDFPDLELLSHAEARSATNEIIQVKASSLFTCYAQNTVTGGRTWDPKVEGWFLTEDRGACHGRTLQIQGRSKDYIKIGGEGTNLFRLRSILDSCTSLKGQHEPKQITLIAMDSQRLGQEIHAVSELNSDITEEILEIYSQKVLPFEKVRYIHYVNEIPRSELGKILWAELRSKL